MAKVTDVEVVTRGSQRVVVKRARGTIAVERLANEATLLRRAAVPGVITYVSYEETRDDADEPTAELVTMAAGDETLASLPPDDEQAAAEIIAGVAAAVADLHSIGIAHRALCLEHVIVGANRRAVLCGLGSGKAVLDPALFLADTEDLAELIDQVRAPFEARNRVNLGLARLAAEARGGELTPRAIAQEAALLAATGNVKHRRVAGAGAKTVAAVLAVGATVAVLTAGGSAARPTAEPQPPPTTAAAPTIERNGVHYRIGLPGDIAVVGAWRCGDEQVALLRPATGEVFVFDEWARPGQPLEATAVARIRGARELVKTAPDGGCAQLYVRTETTQTEIRTEG